MPAPNARDPGSIAQCIGYALDAPAPPFPVMVLAFAINGFGIALQVRRVHLACATR